MSDLSEVVFLQALAAAGFPVSSVSELRERFRPLPERLAILLIDWLPRLTDLRLRETVAWSLLAARKRTLDGRRLAALFDETGNADLKVALAAVFNQTGPLNADDWLIAALGRAANPNLPTGEPEGVSPRTELTTPVRGLTPSGSPAGKSPSVAARNLLASAIAKWLPAEKSVPVLVSIFDRAPLSVVHPLGKVGGSDVRDLLANRLVAATGPLRRELRQAIKRIERRLAKSQPACQCDRP